MIAGFQASAPLYLRSALLWVVTQLRLVGSHRRFGDNLSFPFFKGQAVQYLWNREQYVVPKRRQITTSLRCVTSPEQRRSEDCVSLTTALLVDASSVVTAGFTVFVLLHCPYSPSGQSATPDRFFPAKYYRCTCWISVLGCCPHVLKKKPPIHVLTLACNLLVTFQILNQMSDYYRIWYEYAVGGHANLIHCNFLQWITIWRASEVGAYVKAYVIFYDYTNIPANYC